MRRSQDRRLAAFGHLVTRVRQYLVYGSSTPCIHPCLHRRAGRLTTSVLIIQQRDQTNNDFGRTSDHLCWGTQKYPVVRRESVPPFPDGQDHLASPLQQHESLVLEIFTPARSSIHVGRVQWTRKAGASYQRPDTLVDEP
jgi:hypothetical protein